MKQHERSSLKMMQSVYCKRYFQYLKKLLSWNYFFLSFIRHKPIVPNTLKQKVSTKIRKSINRNHLSFCRVTRPTSAVHLHPRPYLDHVWSLFIWPSIRTHLSLRDSDREMYEMESNGCNCEDWRALPEAHLGSSGHFSPITPHSGIEVSLTLNSSNSVRLSLRQYQWQTAEFLCGCVSMCSGHELRNVYGNIKFQISVHLTTMDLFSVDLIHLLHCHPSQSAGWTKCWK